MIFNEVRLIEFLYKAQVPETQSVEDSECVACSEQATASLNYSQSSSKVSEKMRASVLVR